METAFPVLLKDLWFWFSMKDILADPILTDTSKLNKNKVKYVTLLYSKLAPKHEFTDRFTKISSDITTLIRAVRSMRKVTANVETAIGLVLNLRATNSRQPLDQPLDQSPRFWPYSNKSLAEVTVWLQGNGSALAYDWLRHGPDNTIGDTYIMFLTIFLRAEGLWTTVTAQMAERFACRLGISNRQFRRLVCDSVISPSPRLINTETIDAKSKQRWYSNKHVRMAAVVTGVGALTAVTAGFAAPVFGLGLSTIGLTTGGTFLATTGGGSVLAGAFGTSGAALSGWKLARRYASIKHFELRRLNDVVVPVQPQINLNFEIENDLYSLIHIDGFIPSSNVTRSVSQVSDEHGLGTYRLIYDPAVLKDLGFLIGRIIGEMAISQAAKLSVNLALRAGAAVAMLPVTVLQYASQLDNAWIVAKHKAQQAGKALAEALIQAANNSNTSITLTGSSVGARVIIYCLDELLRAGRFDIVDNVIIMGTPHRMRTSSFASLRQVVNGKFINMYKKTDWVLALMFRYMEWDMKVVGLGPIPCDGYENYDVSDLIDSHYAYYSNYEALLERSGLYAQQDHPTLTLGPCISTHHSRA